MKKKKFLNLAVVIFTLGLAACAGGGATEDGATHHFAADWTADKSKHWHVCTDEDCKEKGDAAAHTFVEDTAAYKAPTCSETGQKVEKCTVCGYEKKTTIHKTAHQYVEDKTASKAATCTEAGVTVEKCSVCGDERRTEIEAIGHEWVEDPTNPGNVNPTHTTAGVKIEKCTHDGCTETREVAIPTVPHEWTKDAAGDFKNADGYDIHKYTCECGSTSYAMAVLDYSFLTEGSNSFKDGTISESDAPEAGEGVRIAGGGSAIWKFPVKTAGKYLLSIGANPAPSAIGNPRIEQKNGIKVNGVSQTLLVSGGYNSLGLEIGKFNELKLAEFDLAVTEAGNDVEIEITQVASQRLFFGGEIRITLVA